LPPNDSKSDLEFEIEIVILWKNLRTNWSPRDTASQQHIVDGHWKGITDDCKRNPSSWSCTCLSSPG
jgi:hypothetical protein